MSNAGEASPQMGDMIRLGTVAAVDLAAARCTVQTGDILTDWIPWLAPRAGATRIWSPPSVGEQVLLLSAEGSAESAVALLGIYSDAKPAPDNSLNELIRFSDGAQISYDPAAHALVATLPAGGTAAITAPGGITITGDVLVNGKLTATNDVLAGSISLKTHKHGGVQAGGAQTGVPV